MNKHASFNINPLILKLFQAKLQIFQNGILANFCTLHVQLVYNMS